MPSFTNPGRLGHDLRVGDAEREGVGGGQGVLPELQRQGREPEVYCR